MTGFAFRFGLPLAVSALFATGAQAQVRLVPMENVPLLKPLMAIKEERGILPPGWNQKFRQRSEEPTIDLHATNANALYQQAYPYPQMRHIPLVPMRAMAQSSSGATAVIGYTRVYANRPDGSVTDEQKTVWTWNVPKAQQRSHVAWGRNSNHDRFSALMLSPSDKTPGNPTLVCFEATAGLQWQQSVPVGETLQQFLEQTHATKVPDQVFTYERNVGVSVTRDGSRLLVLVAQPDYDATLLFVYDGGGSLLKSLAYNGYVGVALNGPLWRLPQGNRFLFTFYHYAEVVSSTGEKLKQRINGDFLADADGNLLCQFVDEAGKPYPFVNQFTEDGAYACGTLGQAVQNDGFVYALPSASNSKRKP